MLSCCALCTACRVVSTACYATSHAACGTQHAARPQWARASEWSQSHHSGEHALPLVGLSPTYAAWSIQASVNSALCDRHWAVRSAVRISRASSRRPNSRSARCTHCGRSVHSRHISASSLSCPRRSHRPTLKPSVGMCPSRVRESAVPF